MIRRTICFCLLLSLFLYGNSRQALAGPDGDDRSIGIEVVGNYSNWDDLNDLNSPIDIANGVIEEFKNEPKKWKVSYTYRNNAVWEKDFKGVSIGGRDNLYADNVDLLIYAGHGVKPKKHGATDYSFALNTKKDTKYAKQSEMYLGNGDLEWLVTFTCNFLESKDLDTIGHMAKGLHAVCGFETTIILTPDMGKTFAAKLKKGKSVKDAFYETVRETRTIQDKIECAINGQQRTVGVFTTKKNAEDRIWGYGNTESDPKSYTKNKSGYILYSYDL